MKISRRQRSQELEAQSREAVYCRDQKKCVICNGPSIEIHEIVSRSHFGTRSLDICFHEKNRVVVCKNCHRRIQGNKEMSRMLISHLQEKYGYEYNEPVFFLYTGKEHGA